MEKQDEQAMHIQKRNTIHFLNPSSEKENWFDGKLSKKDIEGILTPLGNNYNKKLEEIEAKLNETPKEKKVTNNGDPEPDEIDPEKLTVKEQMEFAKDIENALYLKLAEKKVSTAYRWIVSVGYEYSQRFKPTKEDWVAHIEYLFLTISIIMVKGAHELKK